MAANRDASRVLHVMKCVHRLSLIQEPQIVARLLPEPNYCVVCHQHAWHRNVLSTTFGTHPICVACCARWKG